MEEASPHNPSGHHDLLNLDFKNKKSQDRSLRFRSNMQRTCSQDPLGDSKNKKSRDIESIMPTPIEESEEEGGGGTNLISRLPDDVLSNIITKLSTKEGACTQILSRRWQPLWRLSPLNLQVDCDLSRQERTRINLVNKILSNHRGGGRRLYLHQICFRNLHDNSNRWFESRALDNLQELDFCYGSARSEDLLAKPLPSSTLGFSSTLCIFSLGNCHFPTDGNDSLFFPKLKQLSLQCVTMSENAFQRLLSGCPVLESLLIIDCDGLRRVCVTSPTIRSIGVRSSSGRKVETQELVVKDTPCLERLLTFPPKGPTTIEVCGAPRLKVLGYLSRDIGKLEIGSKTFKRMISWNLRAISLCTLKVLVVTCTDPNLGVVRQLLKCFPCLETYIMFSVPRMDTGNAWYESNSLEPIYCLHHHLKKIVIRGYKGHQSDIDFANFFIVNARVLQKMTIGFPRKQSDKWIANQLLKLHLDYKASKNAQLQFMHYYLLTDMDFQKRTHDLSVLDPFDAQMDALSGTFLIRNISL